MARANTKELASDQQPVVGLVVVVPGLVFDVVFDVVLLRQPLLVELR